MVKFEKNKFVIEINSQNPIEKIEQLKEALTEILKAATSSKKWSLVSDEMYYTLDFMGKIKTNKLQKDKIVIEINTNSPTEEFATIKLSIVEILKAATTSDLWNMITAEIFEVLNLLSHMELDVEQIKEQQEAA